MHFALDPWAFIVLALLLLIAGFYLFTRAHSASFPSLAFSRLSTLSLFSKRTQLMRLPSRLEHCALALFCLAFLDPHLLLTQTRSSTERTSVAAEGLAIYLVLDQSGFMTEEVIATDSQGQPQFMSKIKLLKQVTEQFIRQRPSDLMGMVSFARVPRVLAPLTLDHDLLIEQLKQLNVAQSPEDDGTAMGYAIFKTASLISATERFAKELGEHDKPAYEIKNAIMIVVTDGLQDPNQLDRGNRLRMIELDEAASYAKSVGIRLYIINIDPALAAPQFDPHRRQLQAITELTGGQFYLVDENRDLQRIYNSINPLQKSSATIATQAPPTKRLSFYPGLILMGLCCLLVASVLKTTLLRAVP